MRQGSKKGLYCEYQKTHYLNWLSQNHAVSWQQSRALNRFKHDGSDSKESAFNTGGQVQSLGWDYPMEEGMTTHSSILAWRIPMDRGAWWATVHVVAKSQTRLSDFTFFLSLSWLEILSIFPCACWHLPVSIR